MATIKLARLRYVVRFYLDNFHSMSLFDNSCLPDCILMTILEKDHFYHVILIFRYIIL